MNNPSGADKFISDASYLPRGSFHDNYFQAKMCIEMNVQGTDDRIMVVN